MSLFTVAVNDHAFLATIAVATWETQLNLVQAQVRFVCLKQPLVPSACQQNEHGNNSSNDAR